MTKEKEIKKQQKRIEKKAAEFNAIAESINAMTEGMEDKGGDRKVLPCVRIVAGRTEFYNCKTGEAIP